MPRIWPGAMAVDPLGPQFKRGQATIVPYLPGWALPDRFDAAWIDHGGVHVRMTIEVHDNVPRCRTLTVTSQGDGAVNGQTLRQLPVGEMLNQAVAAAVQPETAPGYYRPTGFKSFDDFQAFRKAHPVTHPRERWQLTPEHLREVVKVYRAATTAPIEAVKDHWNKPRATAARWVAKARAEGYFDEESDR